MPVFVSLDIKKMVDWNKMAQDIREGLISGLMDGMKLAKERAKTRMGQPGEIGIVSGDLQRSVQSGVVKSGDSVVGILFSNLRYAKVHEEGAIIPAHLIRARNAKALRFEWHGKIVFFKSVWAKPRYQEPHPYLRPSIYDTFDQVREKVLRSIKKEVEHV